MHEISIDLTLHNNLTRHKNKRSCAIISRPNTLLSLIIGLNTYDYQHIFYILYNDFLWEPTFPPNAVIIYKITHITKKELCKRDDHRTLVWFPDFEPDDPVLLSWVTIAICRRRPAISVKHGRTVGSGAQHSSISLLHSGSQELGMGGLRVLFTIPPECDWKQDLNNQKNC